MHTKYANSIGDIFFFSGAEMNVAFDDRLDTLLDKWIFEASIAFGVGNLRRLLMPVVVFEKTSPNLVEQPEKLVDKSRKSERIILSLNYTMNGKNQFIDNILDIPEIFRVRSIFKGIEGFSSPLQSLRTFLWHCIAGLTNLLLSICEIDLLLTCDA